MLWLMYFVFFLYGSVRGPLNFVFLAMFLIHYLHRGIIHPLTMRYSSATVSLGITLGGFFPNCIYHFINADFISNAIFDVDYFYDPRFILGSLLFIVGYITNRWADLKLRGLRNVQGTAGYYIPYGGMFEVVSCPNYLGELVQWVGWTLVTWSLAGLVWTMFCAATFIPRSYHNHRWYKQQFELYPLNRKALIPFIF
ncbi:uncharacterized protein LOC135481264 [Liolophura sinensis]|uniref:uncharacterized protein LOC135481264 n=1 Tax=Liolophura sinensis TaxID=3198878 RepID=UPI003158EAD0